MEDEGFRVPLLFHLLVSIICLSGLTLQVELALVKTAVEEVRSRWGDSGIQPAKTASPSFSSFPYSWPCSGSSLGYTVQHPGLVVWQKIKIFGT